jgi:hypothetical protein
MGAYAVHQICFWPNDVPFLLRVRQVLSSDFKGSDLEVGTIATGGRFKTLKEVRSLSFSPALTLFHRCLYVFFIQFDLDILRRLNFPSFVYFPVSSEQDEIEAHLTAISEKDL